MSGGIEAADAFLVAGDFDRAWSAFYQLRPNIRLGMEGLNLSARIYFAAKQWPEVDVLCRVMRKEYPTEVTGFLQGAESLFKQGRVREAIDLLKQWPTADGSVSAAIQRLEAGLKGADKESV
jgi:predicted Zn-dependent protease